jgi:hypothetical protein
MRCHELNSKFSCKIKKGHDSLLWQEPAIETQTDPNPPICVRTVLREIPESREKRIVDVTGGNRKGIPARYDVRGCVTEYAADSGGHGCRESVSGWSELVSKRSNRGKVPVERDTYRARRSKSYVHGRQRWWCQQTALPDSRQVDPRRCQPGCSWMLEDG